MKKSVLTLLTIATLAVASFSSCSNDGDSNTPTPDPSQVTTETKVSVKSAITSDAFELFDIQVVRTSGSSSQTYSFNNTMMINDTIPTKATDIDTFTYDKSTTPTVTATVTPKSNWQDIVKARGNKPFLLQGCTNYSVVNTPACDFGSVTEVEPQEITQSWMQECASALKTQIETIIK